MENYQGPFVKQSLSSHPLEKLCCICRQLSKAAQQHKLSLKLRAVSSTTTLQGTKKSEKVFSGV